MRLPPPVSRIWPASRTRWAGVNFTDKGPFDGVNGSNLIMRGLNSESLAFQEGLATSVIPPVATYVDDTPLFFNMRLDDLDRVEVLRGPQGTLYGSGSLGGTIRFVMNAPDPSAFDAKVEAGLSKTNHTHANNEEIKAMVNLPLSDTLAVRINAGASDDAGFVNQSNIYVLGANGVPELSQPTSPGNPVGLNPQIAPKTYSQDGVNSYQYRNGPHRDAVQAERRIQGGALLSLSALDCERFSRNSDRSARLYPADRCGEPVPALRHADAGVEPAQHPLAVSGHRAGGHGQADQREQHPGGHDRRRECRRAEHRL